MTPEELQRARAQAIAIAQARARMAAPTAQGQALQAATGPAPQPGAVMDAIGQARTRIQAPTAPNTLSPNLGLPQDFAAYTQNDPATHFLPGDPRDPTPAPVHDNQLNRGLLNSAIQGPTLNFGDEGAGLIGGIGGWLDPNRTFSEGYNTSRDAFNADIAYAQNADPRTAGFANFFASAATPAGPAKWLLSRAAPTARSIMTRTAAVGGGYGAAAGVGGGDTMEERLTGGAIGLGAGTLGGLAFGAAAGRGAASAAQRAVDTPAQIGQQSRALYTAAENEGMFLTGDSRARLDARLAEAAKNAGAGPGLTQSNAFLTALAAGKSRAVPGAVDLTRDQSLMDLEGMRQQLSRMRESGVEGEANVARAMIRELDRSVAAMTVDDVLAGMGGSIEDAQRYLNDARALWVRRSKADEVGEALRIAEASRLRGGDVNAYRSALRTEFGKIVRSDDFTTRWTAEEQEAILRAFSGGSVENALLRIGRNLAPGGPASYGQILGGIGLSGIGGALSFGATAGNLAATGAGSLAAAVIPYGIGRMAGAAGRGIGSDTGVLADLLVRQGSGQLPRPLSPANAALLARTMRTGAGVGGLPR